MNKWTFVFLLGLFTLFGCSKQAKVESINRFSDPKLERIYELQDRQETRKLIPLLKSKKTHHREAAVFAFASIQDSFAVRFLRENLLTDSKPEVRKAAAYAIGQMRDSANVGTLFMALENEISSDSRKAILEALGKSANQDVIDYFNSFTTTVTQLREGHAKGMFRSVYKKKYGTRYAEQCIRYFDAVSSDETKLFAAWTLARLPHDYRSAYTDTIKSIHDRLTDKELKRVVGTIVDVDYFEPYVELPWADVIANYSSFADKPYALVNELKTTALDSKQALDSLETWSFDHRYQIVRTTAAELFLEQQQILGPMEAHPDLAAFVETCLTSRDMALQSLACYKIIQNPSTYWRPVLQTYQDSLSIPRQMETFIDMGKALAAIDSVKYKKPNVKYNHPIDWAYVKQIPSDQQVEIVTTQGSIFIDLNVDDAPGSVSNFLKKVDEGYYTDKFFHRVVPNFVIQAGCYRGDGWGSPDWTQRSEFSNYLSYSTGAVGLASSGKDTEGVQIFITHNPTPFLDGRYSIFGYVAKGMDIVNDIGVGDKIVEVKKVKQQP